MRLERYLIFKNEFTRIVNYRIKGKMVERGIIKFLISKN